MRDAAHSLRTRLTIARGHLNLADEAFRPGEARDDVRVALDELRRLSAISASLLLLCTAEDPTFLSLRDVEVCKLLRDVAARWQTATRRPVTVEADCALTVRVDEERIRCALDALIENALRGTEHGGQVRLAARRDGPDVVLEVRDGGSGVPAWAREQIFDATPWRRRWRSGRPARPRCRPRSAPRYGASRSRGHGPPA